MRSSLFALQPARAAILAVLLLALLVLGGAAASRGMEYDEGYTVFLAAGNPRPTWPAGTFRAGSVRGAYAGHSSAATLARNLRNTDVHPPLYFWAVACWRGVAGTNLGATRAFSVLCALAALALVGMVAAQCGLPPVAATLLTLGCYGFVYTGAVARGFALAVLLLTGGTALLLRAEARGKVSCAVAAGVALGAAAFTNYLALFAGSAAVLWLLLRQPRTWLWPATALGFAPFLPAGAWFFLAQKDSRVGQFEQFHLLPALARLGRSAAGGAFGGLPLYVPGWAQPIIAGALVTLLAGLTLLVIRRWRGTARPGARGLLLMMAAATPIGLLALGLIFDNTPIELRYLAFAVPFCALLLAGALAGLPAASRRALTALVLAVQAAAVAGLITRPETMQPQAATARAAAMAAGRDGLVLLPFGNDGVGIPAAFIASAPDWLQLRLVHRVEAPAAIAAAAEGSPLVVLALLGLDAASRTTLQAMCAAFAGGCWRPVSETATLAVFARMC